jgi:histidyl-tRNA synthetase
MPQVFPVKGTRDFYPDEMAFHAWLYAKINSVSARYGYQQYEAPYLERLELYAAKSGEELVREQSFVFPDRSGDMIALRPELTPSLARMVAARMQELPRPIRWWSFGPFWRYERPQRGRSREFFQWNIDLLGVDSPYADAEIASIAADFFRSIGLGPDVIRILVNNRRLADLQLDRIRVPKSARPEVFRLIDRRDKATKSKWEQQAAEIGLSSEQFSALEIMLADFDAWKESEELSVFFESAERMGSAEYLAYDPSVIRGLDYYTGIVYEARDVAGKYRAILGGGRYDDLVADVGGDPLPGTGFAMGDMVIELVLEEYNAKPSLRPNRAQILITTFDDVSIPDSLQIATQLRSAGIRAEWFPEADRLGRQLKYADREGIPLALIRGPDERQKGTATLKDLRQRSQVEVPLADIQGRIRSMLERESEP